MVSQAPYLPPDPDQKAGSLLNGTPHPVGQEIDEAMAGNICRWEHISGFAKAIKVAAGKIE